MTSESRIDRLERQLGLDENAPGPAPIVMYNHRDVPQDPAAREAWFKSLRPDVSGPTFYIPDNGRGEPL